MIKLFEEYFWKLEQANDMIRNFTDDLVDLSDEKKVTIRAITPHYGKPVIRIMVVLEHYYNNDNVSDYHNLDEFDEFKKKLIDCNNEIFFIISKIKEVIQRSQINYEKCVHSIDTEGSSEEENLTDIITFDIMFSRHD